MQLLELIATLKSVIEHKDWVQLAELDTSMQQIVEKARDDVEKSGEIVEFQRCLEVLNVLYTEAKQLVEVDREVTAKTLRKMSLGKSGVEQYQLNASV